MSFFWLYFFQNDLLNMFRLMDSDVEDHEEKISNCLDPDLVTDESWNLREELKQQHVAELDSFPRVEYQWMFFYHFGV